LICKGQTIGSSPDYFHFCILYSKKILRNILTQISLHVMQVAWNFEQYKVPRIFQLIPSSTSITMSLSTFETYLGLCFLNCNIQVWNMLHIYLLFLLFICPYVFYILFLMFL
jgi:hypothetical protein